MRHLAGRMLMLAAVALIPSCGGGSSPAPSNPSTPTTTTTPAPTSNADLVITIAGDRGQMSYSPATASVKVGQTVAWRNADTQTHTATQDQGKFDTSSLARDVTSQPIAMGTAGTFSYHCSFHPDMVATLPVTP